MSLDVKQLARAFRVPLIEYDRVGDWLLVSSGSGIMTAVMDAAPRCAWCVDIDELDARSRFDEWLRWSERAARIAIVGRFSITDPAPLRQAIAQLASRPLCYTPFVELGGVHCATLSAFIDAIQQSRS